jgi:hypothetical protein
MARAFLLLFALLAAGLVGGVGVLNGREAIAAAGRGLDRQLSRAGKALAIAEEARFEDLRVVAARAAAYEPLQAALGEKVARGEAPDQATLDAASGALAVHAAPGGRDRSTLLVVVTERGFAESRLGETSRFGDGPRVVHATAALAGDATHGFTVIDDRLYRVVAVPLGPGEKPLGALVLGFPVDDAFAASLEESAGAEVTILRGGNVVASTLPPAERAQVAPAARNGGMLPFSFGRPGADAARLAGVVPAPFLLHGAGSQRASPEPLPGVEGGVVILSLDAVPALAPGIQQEGRLALLAAGLLLLGMLLFALARSAGRAPARASVAGTPETFFPAAGMPAGGAAPELKIALTPGPAGDGAGSLSPAEEATLFARVPEPSSNGPTDPFGGRGDRPPLEKTVIAPVAAPLAATQPRPLAAVGGEGWGEALSGLPAPAASPRDMPFAPPSLYDPFSALAPGAPDRGSDRTMVAEDPTLAVVPEQTVVAAVPAALLRATSRAPEVDPEEAHDHEVFREFLEVRRRCGEGVEGVTFDRFAAKLRKNREQLVEKYRCRTVRFTVYVKDGKTALKATPIKDG